MFSLSPPAVIHHDAHSNSEPFSLTPQAYQQKLLLVVVQNDLLHVPLTPTVAMGTATKHPVPDQKVLSVRVPGCQKLQMTA